MNEILVCRENIDVISQLTFQKVLPSLSSYDSLPMPDRGLYDNFLINPRNKKLVNS